MTIITTESNTAGNTGFASGGVTCKLGALCFYSSLVLSDSFALRNPPERKARKRYEQLKRRTNSVKQSQFMAEQIKKIEVKKYRNCE
jgi:hypothetical protein